MLRKVVCRVFSEDGILLEKRCSRCKTIKPATEFGDNSKNKDKKQPWCRLCVSENSKIIWARDHPIRTKRLPPVPRKTPLPPPDFYVYAYLRTKDGVHGDKGTPYYIGKGKEDRAFSFQHNPKPNKDYSNLVFLASGLTEIDAFQVEVLFIFLHGRIDIKTGCLYNRTNGGEGPSGAIFSQDHCKRISESKKGIPRPEYVKKKLSDAGKGKKRSLESRRKQSETLKRKHSLSQERGAVV